MARRGANVGAEFLGFCKASAKQQIEIAMLCAFGVRNPARPPSGRAAGYRRGINSGETA
jgi:hypothetical protein